MIFQTTIFDIFSYVGIGIEGLVIALILILLIYVGVTTTKKELGPDCKKGFIKFFIAFLLFIMFSKFLELVYSAVSLILRGMAESGAIDFYYYSSTIGIISLITLGLGFLNNWIAYVLLFSSMEVYLFNKKTKWKFIILVLILQFGSFILMIAGIFLPSLMGSFLGYIITNLVVNVLIEFNFIIIGIVILILLGKTAKENNLLRGYTKTLSAGVILLLIILPILNQVGIILNFISGLSMWNGYGMEYSSIIGIISWCLGFLSNIFFIIGIIVISLGAIKTMSVPLTFSKEKGAKGSPRKIINYQSNTCLNCGTSLQPGAEFCTNCGNHL